MLAAKDAPMERGSAFRTRIWEWEGCVSTEPKPSHARAQQFGTKPTEDPVSCAEMTEQGQPARPCPGSEPRGGAAFPQESLPETMTFCCQARSRSNHLLKIPGLPTKPLPPLRPGAPGTYCLHQSHSCWRPPPPPPGAAAAAGQQAPAGWRGAAGRRGAARLASPLWQGAQRSPLLAPPSWRRGPAPGVPAAGSLWEGPL